MVRKRLSIILAAACLSVSALSGCSSSKEQTQEKVEETTEAEETDKADKTEETDKTEESSDKDEEEKKDKVAGSLFSEDDGSDEEEEAEEEEDKSSDDKKDESSEDINELSDSEAKELAEFLSTTEHPNVADFEFVTAALLDDNDYLAEYFGGKGITAIHNPLLVEGGWKGYMTGIPHEYSSGKAYRYFNVDIHTLKDEVSLTLDWWLYYDENNNEYEEDYSSKGTGKWNDDNTGFTVDLDGSFEITKFIYLDDVEYALGKFMWPSGEQDYVVLCRPDGKMEIKDSSDWRY